MNSGAYLAGCQIAAILLFVGCGALDLIGVFFSDTVPVLLIFVVQTCIAWMLVLLVQPMICLGLFPLRKRSAEYMKNVDLATVFSVVCVLLTTFMKGTVYLTIASYYNFAAPFGILMTIDHSGLPFTYLWGYVQAYNCATIFYLLCVFLYCRALSSYYFPISSMD